MARIAIIDFKSSFSKDVGNMFEKLNVEHRFFDHDAKLKDIKDYDGLVFTGSSDTVYEGGKLPEMEVFECGKPILGICYGHQLIHYLLSGEVRRSDTPEKGIVEIETKDSLLFKDLPAIQKVEMHHDDEVVKMAPGFICTASEKDCLISASENVEKKMYSVQFHPEAEGNDYGKEIFSNFVRIVENEED